MASNTADSATGTVPPITDAAGIAVDPIAPPDPGEATELSSGAAWYMLIVLMLTNTLSYLDRQLPFILGEPIKRELHLSDVQLGLLGGASFMIVYSTVAIPLSRLADRKSHVGVLSGAVLVWSLLTSAGAWAQTFFQLILSRVGVAAGEAGAIPPAHAMIARVFDEKRRGKAMSIYQLGLPLGTMCGLAGGGFIADHGGWRLALMVMGVPGILLALLVATTIKLPPRRKHEMPRSSESLLFVFKRLLGEPAYRNLVFGITAFAFISYGFSVFQPAVLIRIYGLTTTETGLAIGLSQGGIGVVGTLLSGYVSDRLSRRDPRWRPWLSAILLATIAPFFIAAQFAPNAVVCVILLWVPLACFVGFLPPAYAAIQEVTPPHMRAMAAGIMVLCINLIGSSLGPLLTGALSDALKPALGLDALRVALSVCVIFPLIGSVFFLRAAHHLARARARL
ncbi:spinster family MFS transporter [Sphingomonas immobilis]|uniref:MFS transporter n=1 Tax=Sphingomonas immobilis TaxID=3063997 RepID=A0ABT9A1J1_9SPHN|nr:MFS transporter [Sphingomonas sp. CA1-15]MDO7843125.1 MFS transporter [Sphingomonas sp. CA1-15]